MPGILLDWVPNQSVERRALEGGESPADKRRMEPGDTSATIQRARPCTQCGYNLYNLSREGSCPECGHAYKKRRQDGSPKNPRRQLPQLRRVLLRRESELRWLPAWWCTAAAAFAACYFLRVPCFFWGVASMVTLGAAGHHLGAVLNHRDVKQKIEGLDMNKGAE